jgi:hypothetical protein
MSDSMLERVARAILSADLDITDFNLSEKGKAEILDSEWCEWVLHAKAAINAMRDPTKDMLAACEIYEVVMDVTQSEMKTIWQAMIDAALNETDRQ